MQESSAKSPRISRESRLLILTVAVCVIVLLLLARIRFPETPVVQTVAPPLERLAARVSYDALAEDAGRVAAMIAPNLVVIQTIAVADPTPIRTRDVLEPSGTPYGRHVAALRVSPGGAVAAIGPGLRISGVAGDAGAAAVLATDPIRHLSRLRVPEAPSRPVVAVPDGALRTPAYVIAVEGTHAGVTVRPVFLGQGAQFDSARWARPLLPLGGIALAPGALVFSLTGEFIGCVVMEDGAPALASARDVLETAERLAAASPPVPATLGIAVQPLTPPLTLATGAAHGVVVSQVEPDGPAAELLWPGDVIVSVRGEALDRPDRFLLHVAGGPPGDPMELTVVRNGVTLETTVVPAAVAGGALVPLSIDVERRPGAETRVVAAPADEGVLVHGLRPGDVVIRAGDVTDPTPDQFRALLATLPPDALLAVTVRRGTEQRVVAVGSHARTDAPTD